MNTTETNDDVSPFERMTGLGGGSPADVDTGDYVTGHCRGCGGEFPTLPGSKCHTANRCINCYA